MRYIVTIILLFSIGHLTVEAQQRVVTGHVYAFKDLCLKNIKVEAKKSGAKVATDSLGNFSIVCEKKDRLKIHGAGFSTVFKSIRKQDNVIIKMVFAGGEKNEEVAVGYGIVNRDDLTFAVSHYSTENNDYANYTDVFELIEGKFAGVQVVSVGGEKKVMIRGITTVNADNYAKYVVDGVMVSDISYLTPSWIKSIDVLKDGAASMYGVQGGTGIVLITTAKRLE